MRLDVITQYELKVSIFKASLEKSLQDVTIKLEHSTGVQKKISEYDLYTIIRSPSHALHISTCD